MEEKITIFITLLLICSLFSVFYNKCVDAFNCLLCPATCISGAKNDGKLIGLEINREDRYL